MKRCFCFHPPITHLINPSTPKRIDWQQVPPPPPPPPPKMMLMHFPILISLIFLLQFISTAFGFSCFTCNTNSDADDDTEPCEEKAEECPEGDGTVQSCSTLLYFSNRANPGRPHVRKFCTSPGIPLGSLLERFPLKTTNGGGFCQSVDRWISQQSRLIAFPTKTRRNVRRTNNRPRSSESEPESPFPFSDNKGGFQLVERKKRSQKLRGAVSPPAPPQSHSSTLLCICTQNSLCNAGDFQDILGRSVIGNLDGNGAGRKEKFEIEEIGNFGVKELPIR